MHKLLFTGLVGSGILAFGLAVPAQAMKLATNVDLKMCLGLYIGGSCNPLGPCSPGAGMPSQDCGAGDDNSACYDVIGAGPVENYTCGTPGAIEGCTGIGAYQPCALVTTGICVSATLPNPGGPGSVPATVTVYGCNIAAGAVAEGSGGYYACTWPTNIPGGTG